MPSTSGPIPPSRERDEETLKLVLYLFKELVKEENITFEQAVGLLPEYFLQWTDSKVNTYQIDENVIHEAQCKPIGWAFLQEILRNAAGVLMIAPMWPMVVLSYRGNPKYKIKSLHTVVTIAWEDGTIVPISRFLPAEIMEGGEVNDAFAATQLVQHFKAFQREIIEGGLDQIHDRAGENYGGDHPFHVLMGAFQKIIPQLKPELHEHLNKWMRLIQFLIEPPIPPAIRAKIEAKRQQMLQKPVQGPGPVGGFG